MSELIDRQAAIDICNNAIDLWHGQLGEGIVIAVKKKIEELPSAQPKKRTEERTETHACDLISRQAAIDALQDRYKLYSWDDGGAQKAEIGRIIREIHDMSSAQPEPCGDMVSRNAIVQKLNKMDRYVSTELRLCDTDKKFPQNEVFIVDDVYEEIVEQLPSAQPKRTCVNCGRTINNGGWYADGRTRCPIEEHYALPKDGFCHLWEKRNITDDDYPERRTDEGD